jgi:hypothetical protein
LSTSAGIATSIWISSVTAGTERWCSFELSNLKELCAARWCQNSVDV